MSDKDKELPVVVTAEETEGIVQNTAFSRAAGLIFTEMGHLHMFIACVKMPDNEYDMCSVMAADLESAVKTAEKTMRGEVVTCVRVAQCIKDIEAALTGQASGHLKHIEYLPGDTGVKM